MHTCLKLVIILLLFLPSCRNDSPGNMPARTRSKDEMADINRYLITKDRERIVNYIERKGLVMKESPTGLWYSVIEEGKGEYFRQGDRILFNYDCTLLDGTKCYSSDELGPREIVLGKSQAEAGLAEGLQLLKLGSVATFIMPPYLAFGLIGDGKKIPSRAIVVYNVVILQP